MSEHGSEGVPLAIKEVQEIIGNKSWYSLKPETGAFDFGGSVGNLAIKVGLSGTLVEDAIVNSFSKDSLTTLRDVRLDGRPATILEAFKELGVPMYLWTLGDPIWQEIKYSRTEIEQFIPRDKFFSAEIDKHALLPGIVKMITGNGPGQETGEAPHIIVVVKYPIC